jgi:hypothetical protein
MENVSPLYEDVSICDWADQIRQMKIDELRENINMYKNMSETEAEKYGNPERYKKIIGDEINFLESKIKILEKK